MNIYIYTDSNVISTETGYFGGIGLGYTEVPELEIPEDPTDERAGRIVMLNTLYNTLVSGMLASGSTRRTPQLPYIIICNEI